MTLFFYQAVNSAGETVEGEQEAIDEIHCVQQLQQEGYIPLRVKPATSQTFLGFQLNGQRGKLSNKHINDISFYDGFLSKNKIQASKSLNIKLGHWANQLICFNCI